jgi:uncharacterized protein (TIGR02452 family)
MKKNLIDVFQDTLEVSKSIPNKSETTKHTFDDILGPFLSEYNGNVIVEPIDTVSSLQKWSELGKTCILNMASAKRPGGGVENGATAQEESMFRCSNLWNSIDRSHYPLKMDECLYTENSTFFKDRNYDLMEPIDCDVMTIAAINLNEMGHFLGKRVAKFNDLNKTIAYEDNTRNKIRLMASIPSTFGVRNLILGAWGCGVYKNDPERMAGYFRDVIIGEGYHGLYDMVIFAIINDNNSVGNNYEIFDRILNN